MNLDLILFVFFFVTLVIAWWAGRLRERDGRKRDVAKPHSGEFVFSGPEFGDVWECDECCLHAEHHAAKPHDGWMDL